MAKIGFGQNGIGQKSVPSFTIISSIPSSESSHFEKASKTSYNLTSTSNLSLARHSFLNRITRGKDTEITCTSTNYAIIGCDNVLHCNLFARLANHSAEKEQDTFIIPI